LFNNVLQITLFISLTLLHLIIKVKLAFFGLRNSLILNIQISIKTSSGFWGFGVLGFWVKLWDQGAVKIQLPLVAVKAVPR
jgi:hypothetical protein